MKDRFEERAVGWNMSPRILAMFRNFTEVFLREITVDSSMNLLDIGGGTGLVAFELASRVKMVTIAEQSPAMAAVARERITAEQISNCTIVTGAFPEDFRERGPYHRVYAHMSLHHIPDLTATAQKINALLVPGGVFCIGDLYEEDGSFHGADPVPHNGFNPAELQRIFESKGFDAVRKLELDPVLKGEPVREYKRFFLAGIKK